MTGRNGERDAVLISSGFVLGMVAGFLLKDAAKRAYKRARIGQWHREYEETVTYDENLPDQLERREPAPQPGQPRYGGTGAIGVPPESAL
jgi:hypothetical protein